MTAICKYCHQPIRHIAGVWEDNSGADICGVHFANCPHVANIYESEASKAFAERVSEVFKHFMYDHVMTEDEAKALSDSAPRNYPTIQPKFCPERKHVQN